QQVRELFRSLATGDTAPAVPLAGELRARAGELERARRAVEQLDPAFRAEVRAGQCGCTRGHVERARDPAEPTADAGHLVFTTGDRLRERGVGGQFDGRRPGHAVARYG